MQREKHCPRKRGVTLIEVLIVVAIIALISGGISVAAVKFLEEAKVKTTTTNARQIRGAVKTWWINNNTDNCPSIEDLVASGTLDKDATRRDAWGQAWHIDCTDDDVTVTSDGRDRKPGTPDDIRVPPT